MTEQEITDSLDFHTVCEKLGIVPTTYHFAQAWRHGLVKNRAWVDRFLVSACVLVVALDEHKAVMQEMLAKFETIKRKKESGARLSSLL